MSTSALNLRKALSAGAHTRLALVGAGGKTTAMFQLARQIQSPVLLSASTHLGEWQAALADQHYVIEHPDQIPITAPSLQGVCLFTGPLGGEGRFSGLNPAAFGALAALADRLDLPVLVEADGSRQLALKAPAQHEPVIPSWVRQVVVVVGLSAVGQTLNADPPVIHRPQQIAKLLDLPPDARIDPVRVARLLCHPLGGLKGIPPGAERIALLNQADDPARQEIGQQIADKLLNDYDRVIIAARRQESVMAVCQPTAGIVLAGGASNRLGQPKALLSWQGQALIRHIAARALASGLSPVVVVLGALDEPIRRALEGLPVVFAHNPDWQAGQSTSLRAGLKTAQQSSARTLGAVIYLLADQPFLSTRVLQALREQHQSTLAPVIAPFIGQRRTNPVLFDQVTFAALMQLEGDTGGRAIFDRFALEALPWTDSRLLLDVDTPADLQHLREMEQRDAIDL